jgi:hypothetical protein
MPRLPEWLVILVGAVVVAFGLFRVRMAFRSKEEDFKARERGGLYAYPRRTHGLVGVLYIVMGVLLVLSGMGVRLFACNVRQAPPPTDTIEVQPR